MPGVLEKTATPCNETIKIEIMIFWVFHTIGLTKYSYSLQVISLQLKYTLVASLIISKWNIDIRIS